MRRAGSVSLLATAVMAVSVPALADPDAATAQRNAHPSPSSSSGPRSWQADFADKFRKHRPTPEEMREAMSAAHANQKERHEAHVADIERRFPRSALREPEVMAEFRVYARRMAFLNRAKVVATTDLEEPKRSTTLTRIDALMNAEQARHERRVAALRAKAGPGASGSAVASAFPPSPPSADAVSSPPPLAAASTMPSPSAKHPGPFGPPGSNQHAHPRGKAP